ncbi:MAG: aminotransferase class V-fold PLP-dependent enzyme [Saprospiraceae bacterium]
MNLVADMSSDFLARPVDVSKYALIYGGAQKIWGPAGVTVVIVKEDILGKVERQILTMVDYRTHISKGSMFNTPPVFPIFALVETLKWLKALGGVNEIYKMNIEKAGILYNEIERNSLFEANIPDPDDRSMMNITFVLKNEYKDKEQMFLDLAAERDIVENQRTQISRWIPCQYLQCSS